MSMKRHILSAILLGAALFSSSAFAEIANTSQRGSLLIFPQVTVDDEDSSNTLIEISNGAAGGAPITIECSYINELKDRVDFDFTLTAKATASWDVLTGEGTIAAPPFPSGGTFPYGNSERG